MNIIEYVRSLDLPCEASSDMITLPHHAPSTQGVIHRASIYDGVAFVTLDDLEQFKVALGRPKDTRDLELTALHRLSLCEKCGNVHA